jgi:hypothetical protein
MNLMFERRRRYVALLALLLGGALLGGLFAILWPADVWGATPWHDRAPDEELVYRRVQTVTLRSPQPDGVYTTSYGTRFQISIQGYTLGHWIRMPHDVVTNAASCQGYQGAPCEVIWGERVILGEATPVVTFAGSGVGDIYLDYETWMRATRSPNSPEVSLEYPVGPLYDEKFSITNTILFSREGDLRTAWQLAAVGPSGYVYSPTACAFAYSSTACSLVWNLPETSHLDFSVTFIEPLLGSDLIVEDIELSTDNPSFEESIRYTLTVKNIGAYTTGRAVIAGIFVRPYEEGPPVLTDTLDKEDALVDWIEPSKPPISWTYWWIGLAPGERVTGTTVMEWPNWCNGLGTTEGECWVWGYVDCLAAQSGFEWYGHNPEGMMCDLDEDTMRPTCEAEQNNLRDPRAHLYLPLVLRNSG